VLFFVLHDFIKRDTLVTFWDTSATNQATQDIKIPHSHWKNQHPCGKNLAGAEGLEPSKKLAESA